MTSSSHGPSRSASLNCSHLSTLLKSQNQQILETYALACSLARTPLPHTGVQCQTCSRVDRILVCLCCGYTGCNDHIKSHCQEPSNHLLSTDITTAECPIFCAKCCDYCSNTVLLRRSNIQLNTSDAATPGYQASTGLRGIYNMGATCFISVILQVLVHNPLIRNFYLAGGHDRMECTQKASCLACCLDGLFTDFYSSNSVQGYGISSFLMASFNARKTFSGASEQDAHEFLQFLLDELHKSHFLSATFSKIKNTSPSADDEITSCDCVSHRCFNGKLESRIKCDDCGYVTSTIDPMLDLSLGIKTFSSKSSISLSECLDRFTSPEKLDVPFFCKQCAFRKPVKKRLCVKRLPAVLCLQLKRFEHAGMSAKIETHVDYPLFLDMSRYTVDQSTPLTYELYGVVCHQGSLNTGHYTCVIKSDNGVWYHFDDSMVTQVPSSKAHQKDAYLLFYIISEFT